MLSSLLANHAADLVIRLRALPVQAKDLGEVAIGEAGRQSALELCGRRGAGEDGRQLGVEAVVDYLEELFLRPGGLGGGIDVVQDEELSILHLIEELLVAEVFLGSVIARAEVVEEVGDDDEERGAAIGDGCVGNGGGEMGLAGPARAVEDDPAGWRGGECDADAQDGVERLAVTGAAIERERGEGEARVSGPRLLTRCRRSLRVSAASARTHSQGSALPKSGSSTGRRRRTKPAPPQVGQPGLTSSAAAGGPGTCVAASRALGMSWSKRFMLSLFSSQLLGWRGRRHRPTARGCAPRTSSCGCCARPRCERLLRSSPWGRCPLPRREVHRLSG